MSIKISFALSLRIKMIHLNYTLFLKSSLLFFLYKI